MKNFANTANHLRMYSTESADLLNQLVSPQVGLGKNNKILASLPQIVFKMSNFLDFGIDFKVGNEIGKFVKLI